MEKSLAGAFAGAGSLLLIYLGHVQEGSLILMGLLAYFVGEVNGARQAA